MSLQSTTQLENKRKTRWPTATTTTKSLYHLLALPNYLQHVKVVGMPCTHTDTRTHTDTHTCCWQQEKLKVIRGNYVDMPNVSLSCPALFRILAARHCHCHGPCYSPWLLTTNMHYHPPSPLSISGHCYQLQLVRFWIISVTDLRSKRFWQTQHFLRRLPRLRLIYDYTNSYSNSHSHSNSHSNSNFRICFGVQLIWFESKTFDLVLVTAV